MQRKPKFLKKPLQLIDGFSNGIQQQKNLVSPHAINEQFENELKKTVSFITVSKRINCPSIIFTNEEV